jgi:hypothetical protein
MVFGGRQENTRALHAATRDVFLNFVGGTGSVHHRLHFNPASIALILGKTRQTSAVTPAMMS